MIYVTPRGKIDGQGVASEMVTLNGEEFGPYPANVIIILNAVEAAKIRVKRDTLLRECDFTQLGDFPTPSEMGLWVAYRRDLREVPEQLGFPFDVVWPVAPGG